MKRRSGDTVDLTGGDEGGIKSQKIVKNNHAFVLPLSGFESPSSSSKIKKITFESCLSDEEASKTGSSSPRSNRTILLRRACSLNEIDNDSWLSSSFIDLVVARFARCYPTVKYLSVDFTRLVRNMSEQEHLTDINGKVVDYQDLSSPIVFVFNSHNIHWNLIRIVRSPHPELQLFEPMGMPHNRHGGLNLRSVPRDIVNWLDKRCALPDGRSWLTIGHSAIPDRHQLTSFDCGVACLLYAEKCGQGESKESIHMGTTQDNITTYRKVLQSYMDEVRNSMD